MLDARVVSVIARFIHKVATSALNPAAASTAAGGAAGAAASAAEAAEAVVVAGQALDALRMLLDPDLSLAPSAPREQRLRVRSCGRAGACEWGVCAFLCFCVRNNTR